MVKITAAIKKREREQKNNRENQKTESWRFEKINKIS